MANGKRQIQCPNSELAKARTAEREGLGGEALALPFFKMGTKKLFYLDFF